MTTSFVAASVDDVGAPQKRIVLLKGGFWNGATIVAAAFGALGLLAQTTSTGYARTFPLWLVLSAGSIIAVIRTIAVSMLYQVRTGGRAPPAHTPRYAGRLPHDRVGDRAVARSVARASAGALCALRRSQPDLMPREPSRSSDSHQSIERRSDAVIRASESASERSRRARYAPYDASSAKRSGSITISEPVPRRAIDRSSAARKRGCSRETPPTSVRCASTSSSAERDGSSDECAANQTRYARSSASIRRIASCGCFMARAAATSRHSRRCHGATVASSSSSSSTTDVGSGSAGFARRSSIDRSERSVRPRRRYRSRRPTSFRSHRDSDACSGARDIDWCRRGVPYSTVYVTLRAILSAPSRQWCENVIMRELQ